jgi:hypothetical protein
MSSPKTDPQKSRLVQIKRMEEFIAGEGWRGKERSKEKIFTVFQYNTGASYRKTQEYFDIVVGFHGDEFIIDGDSVTFLTKEQAEEKRRKAEEIQKMLDEYNQPSGQPTLNLNGQGS